MAGYWHARFGRHGAFCWDRTAKSHSVVHVYLQQCCVVAITWKRWQLELSSFALKQGVRKGVHSRWADAQLSLNSCNNM